MSPQALIEKTKAFIAIPSTKDNPAALRQAVDFVADVVAARCPDVTIERFERNGKPSFLAYQGTTRPEKFDILLNGHVDVVPGSPELFKPVVKDGKLYGRGALDMKGTTLVLADVFCELVHEVPYALGLQIVCDEEIGGYDGVRLQIDQGVRAEFVVMGEYANDRNTIYNAARGLCWAEIAFKGKSAHGGHLWHGKNAVVQAGEFAGAVLKRYPTPDQETWTTTASIANLSTPNETYNKVPDMAILKIDFRFTQEDPVFADEASVRAFIASIDPEAELVNTAVFEPAVNVEELNPYVQGLNAAIHRVTKKPAKFLGRPAASDGRHYALVNNDIIEFGLYGKNSHSDNEYVELDSFAEYQATVRAFLRNPQATAKQQKLEPLQQKLLRELVTMPTVTSDRAANNAALGFIAKFLASRGMHVNNYEYDSYRSLVATTKPGNKHPTVMLCGHIDVVPGPPDQFTLTAKGDRLSGRGVLDMKASIASYLWLVDELQGELDQYDFSIMITSDEEIGGRQGTKQLLEQENYHPKVAIVPDGGESWQLERFAKGVQWIRLDATGKSAHASRPWEGDSAIRRLLAALHDIQALIPPERTPEDTLLSVGTIEGGTTANQIPAAASAMLDVRYGSTEDYEQLYPKIQAVCKRNGVQPTLLVSDPPCINDPENTYIKTFSNAVAAVTGHTPGTAFSYATTDGRYFSAIGVPCIITLPPGGGRHHETEWLSKQGYEQFCTILKQYIQEIAHRPSKPAPRRSVQPKPQYVWYATYGSGLSKENFHRMIRGGALEGSTRQYIGCTDKTLPPQDAFISIPHELYFAGECKAWGGGGHVMVKLRPHVSAHTIARAYLVTVEQFTELAALQNERANIEPLPFGAAIKHGHSTITTQSDGEYEELVYCGQKGGWPIFTLAAIDDDTPYVPPTAAYMRLLCKGLSENVNTDTKAAVHYLMDVPGIHDTYQPAELVRIFKKLDVDSHPAKSID